MGLYRLGIDVGSTTVKVAVVGEGGELVFSDYRRHNAETLTTLQAMLRDAQQVLGNAEVDMLITGSAGMGISETFGLPFIQEVVASAEVVHQRYPDVKTLIDIGGEDAKIIFFSADGVPDIRMNGSCAGGTGAFIDQMATLLNVPVGELSDLAEAHNTIYPMASRCGVFAKTDVQNLLSREIPREDIAASIFNAVVLQTLATLARGYRPSPRVLFSGGPLTFLPALKHAFMRVLKLGPADLLDAERAELLPAIGAALANGTTERGTFKLAALADLLGADRQYDRIAQDRLPALFSDEADFQQWSNARMQHRIERVSAGEVADGRCFLGVDSGSTTTKVVLIDERGRIAYSRYANNNGDPIGAVRAGLEEIRQQFEACEPRPRIMRSVVTGYGEDLIRAAFGFDEGMVETLAHYRAARAFDPDVSFILDIGGQDMKAIFVKDEHIQNIEINEACSSGCGSFIESFARSMGYSVAEFAERACTASAPCDLGTRCTVFMNSKVKQALREGATVGDISAGLAYSVIKNAIHKVLKLTNMSVLGEHIVVQGGTFRNPAIHKAVEHLTGKAVLCPDVSELMGAYGAALAARDTYLASQNGYPGYPLTKAAIEATGDYAKKTIRCKGCQNQCVITRLTFQNENVFFTGNRCERIFTSSGQKVAKGANLFTYKYDLLFDRETEPAGDGEPIMTIGLPRAMNIYENYPFWHALFTACGVKVQLSAPSSNAIYEKGAGTVMSENICFPAKLAHGHIIDLIEQGVDRIFYPMVPYEQVEYADALNSYNCPIVAGYPDVIRNAIDPAGQFGVPFDMPAVTFKDAKLLAKVCYRYLKQFGIDRRTFDRAFAEALDAQAAYKAALQARGAAMLDAARAEGRRVVLLVGRPYQLDPLINHKVPEILADFGVDVIDVDAVPQEAEPTIDNKYVLTQWAYSNRYYHAVRWAAEQDDVEVVQFNSFGCGPDAITVDEVKTIMSEHGKGHTALRIDEIVSTGSVKLRLRSMIEAMKQSQSKNGRVFTPRRTTRVFQDEDQKKTVLAPEFSYFYAAPLVRPLAEMGYNVVTLPPASRESVDVGLKYTNHDICYPATVVIGDIIRALQSGQYDPADVAVGITQTGGPCRASSYLALLRRALVAAGYEQTPIVSLSTSLQKLNEQPGFELDTKRYSYLAMLGIVYADAISAMYYATAIRELDKGGARALSDKYMEMLAGGTLPLKRGAVLDTLRRAVAEFNALPVDGRHYPRVGLVGEIYDKYNDFANYHVADWLMEQGLEVVVAPLIEFFASWEVSDTYNVRSGLKRADFGWLRLMVAQGFIKNFLGAAERVLKDFRHYRLNHSIKDVAEKAQNVVDLAHQYGEGWLIAGEVGNYVHDGVMNVLCLQPFGCIANHVVARGIERGLKERYPGLNLLFLDTDAGVSEVNFFNRLYFFVNHALQHEVEPV